MSDEDMHFRVKAHEVAEASIFPEEIERALRSEYERGFKAGQQQQLADEFAKFQNTFREEILQLLRSVEPPAVTPETMLTEKAKETVTHDEDHQPVLPRAPGPTKNPPRPPGLPSNLAMALAAIAANDGKASNTQVRDYVRKHYWPGVPTTWSNCLWTLATEKKLDRDGINFTAPKPKDSASNVAARVDTKLAPAPRPNPVVGGLPKAIPPAHAKGEEFQWKDAGVVILAPREYLLASRLRAAMGKGHIGVQFLAENALGMKRASGDEAKLTLRELANGMADRLASIGLKIEYHDGFGFLMKESDVG